MDAGFNALREAFGDRWLGWFWLAVLQAVNGALGQAKSCGIRSALPLPQGEDVVGVRRRLAKEVGWLLPSGRQGQLKFVFFVAVEVGEDEQVVAVFGFAQQGEHRRLARAEPGEFCAVAKAWVRGEQLVQFGEFGDDVYVRAPVQTGAAVDVYFLFGQPLDAAREAVSAVDACERAEPVSEQRPVAAFFGQAIVVVRFAVMNEQADSAALLERMVEITGDLAAGEFLEQLRVGPLHAALGEACFGVVPAAAEALEQKNSVRKFQANFCGDIAPNRQRHLVAGVAAEAIDTTAAPRQECFLQLSPKRNRPGVDLDEVFPNHAPSAGAFELAIVQTAKPFGVIFLQHTPPAGVVDDEVEHEVAAESVRLIGQLNELVDAGCFAVELNQRRIDRREVERGVRAAVTAHARVESGRRWVDGEQVQPLAFEAAKDVRQLGRQVAQRSAWRDDRPAAVLELGQTLIERRGGRLVGGFGRTEQAREGAVNSVPETGVRRVDADRDVFALNPVVETGRVADVGSRLEKTGLVQRHVDAPSAVVGRHLEVTPAFVRRCAAGLDRVDD